MNNRAARAAPEARVPFLMRWLRETRSWLAFTHDVLATLAAWCLAFLLRFNLEPSPLVLQDMLKTAAWVVPFQALSFVGFGLYRGLWRYASWHDLQRIIAAVALGAAIVPLVVMMVRLDARIPRLVLAIYPVVLLLIMGGNRLAYRAWKEHRLETLFAGLGEPVVVLGAGDTGVRLVKEFARSREWRVVGLLDDDPRKHGLLLNRVRVLGNIAELPKWTKQFGLRQAIIAMPSASHEVRHRVANLCAEAGLQPLTVPAYEDLISGRLAVNKIRQIELDDLLGRDPVRLDNAGLTEWLGGRVVMITGAGGSIGSELCRQVARFQPSQLVLLDLSEYALYQIEQALLETFPGLEMVPLVGDVRNAALVDRVLRSYRPSVIFHAAAYKHVPLMEAENAWEAVSNNALGTYVVGAAAKTHGVEKFVLVSTDKAINPTSIMGASKRLAEVLCQILQNGDTRFVIVRFGNVLGSTGSVIPRFREQIAKGGPVTVTHPDIARYFMSVSEATQLVMQAGLIGQGGDVLVLDMGKPVKIVDLARDMIRLTAERPEEIPIVFTGLRPGEKLFEELLSTEENSLPTPHPKLRIVGARPASAELLPSLLAWLRAPTRSTEEVRAQLGRWIPEYAPTAAAGTPLRPTSVPLPPSPLLH